MISNWDQIDTWVKSNYSKILDKERISRASDDDKIAPFKSAFLIPNIKEREKEQASLRAKSKEIADNNWQSVQTVGDGTCLLHALLLSTSSTYRKIPSADRSAVGIAFRQGPILDLFSGVDDNGVRYPPSHILSKEYIRGSYNFLENEHIQILSQLLQLNFYIIVKQGSAVEGIQNYMSPGNPWVFTLCRNPNHYSSIYLGSQKKFMLTDKEFILLYPNINKESIDYVVKLPLYNLINSSEDPSKPAVRTNFLSTPLEELEGKLNTYSNFLKINRGLLHNAYTSSRRMLGDTNEIVRLRANVRRDEMAKSEELLRKASSKPLTAHLKMKEYIISKSLQTYERVIKKILSTEISKDMLEKCDTLAGLQKGTLFGLYTKSSGSNIDKKNAIIHKLREQLNNELDEIQAMNYSKLSSKNIQSLILTYNKLLKNIQAGGTRKRMRKRKHTTRSR
jgi:hypothetical protein